MQKMTDIQNSLQKIESGLKEDFRINREENSGSAKANREELGQGLRDIKSELSQTLANITGSNQSAIESINKTLDAKIELLTKKIDENNTANRDTLTRNLKDFTLEQRGKFEDLRTEQQSLKIQTTDLLEKIAASVESKLNLMFEQNQIENSLLRDTLTATFKGFQDTFSQNVEAFNTLQRDKFARLEEDFAKLITNTEKIFEGLKVSIDERLQKSLKAIEDSSKTDSVNTREALVSSLKTFQEAFDRNVKSFNDVQVEKFGNLESKQDTLIKNTESKLEFIRVTVEEKLEKTLSDRLGQSFETVGKQLNEVQKGLGEMQTLAQDVGGLKKVLSNVKMRGGIGEVQLSMLLDQILAPDQYQPNVKTKQNSNEIVEFAIKLPGRDDNNVPVWLPVDAKFPKDKYETLQAAYDTGDTALIDTAQKDLETTIKRMAKDIHDKYIDPPNTTDFGIMFLPFESLFAEVVRKASLLEELNRTYKIIVTGPTTLAAILNSLQMGFKTLAIQKRSSEVWKVLGAVKKEFEQFGGLMEKAQNNIQTGLNQLDDVMGKRTRAIQRQLRNVESTNEISPVAILPGAAPAELFDDEAEE